MSLPAFLAFSFCASSIYIYNDIRDVEHDRLHPKKMRRPIAAGLVSKRNASLLAVFLVVVSFVISYWIGGPFFYLVLSYFLIQVLYSTYLKKIAVVDIFCIASGFVIRVLAGGSAFHVSVSKWLLLTMFMISLVLASGKRLGEVSMLHETAEKHRKSLNTHSISTLSEILVISSAAALISYALYTVEQFTNLIYTIPIVTLGLFRYLLVSKQGIGDPTEALTKDRWLAFTVVLWLLSVGIMRYYFRAG